MSDQDEIEKAFMDTMLYGTGYTKVTAEGIKHVPNDRVKIKFGGMAKECPKCWYEIDSCVCGQDVSYDAQAVLDGKLRLLNDLDADLERRIDIAYERMLRAEDDAVSREYFHELAGLVRQRSGAQIAKMELERRISRPSNE
jgi:hypothetical protein